MLPSRASSQHTVCFAGQMNNGQTCHGSVFCPSVCIVSHGKDKGNWSGRAATSSGFLFFFGVNDSIPFRSSPDILLLFHYCFFVFVLLLLLFVFVFFARVCLLSTRCSVLSWRHPLALRVIQCCLRACCSRHASSSPGRGPVVLWVLTRVTFDCPQLPSDTASSTLTNLFALQSCRTTNVNSSLCFVLFCFFICFEMTSPPPPFFLRYEMRIGSWK